MTSAVAANWDSLLLHEINPTGNEIGRGAYGRVFEVNYVGTLCAAKEVHALLLQSQGDEHKKVMDNFLSECQIWSTLRHPCIVQFLGVYYPEKDQYKLPVMVMEKMQFSLKDLMEKYDNVPLNVKLSILDEVCLGLRYLHTRNPPIVHRDLTPNNILLGYHLEAKITDLGVAKVMKTTDTTKTMTKVPGTRDFMPPESLGDRPVYGLPLDIFSYGGVILYTITHQWPQPSSWVKFDHSDQKVVLSEVERRQRYLDSMTGDAADLKPLVASCLNDNPKNRPPVAQVSLAIRMLKDVCSKKNDHDGMSPIAWWGEVCHVQHSQEIMASSLGTSVEEMMSSNEELQRQIDTLKNDNTKLTSVLKKINSNNENQVQQINSQTSEINAMKEEITELKAKNHRLKQQLVLKTPGYLFNGPVNIKWENGAAAPVHCALHTAVWLNGLVYVGGIFEAGWKDSYAIYCYDPVDDSWDSPINTPYCYFAMTVLNDNLLTVGGRDKVDKKTNQVLMMDGGQLRSYTRMSAARSSATAVGHQGMLIITGGIDDKNETLSSTELYDSNSGYWHICDKLPRAHYRLQSAIVDNILYLLGGYNDDGVSPAVFAAPLDTLPKHQLRWNAKQDTPWCHCAPVSVCGTHLLTVGGDGEKDNEVILTSDIYKFNKAGQSWEVIGHIPAVRESSAVVSTNDNKLIVIGGRDFKEFCTNTVWIGSCEPQL